MMRYPVRFFFFMIMFIFSTRSSPCEIIDTVAAFIDDTAITMSELEASYEKARTLSPDITRLQVLNTMINRHLLLQEAKDLRLQAPDDETLLNEYIDLKIKSFIKINETEIRDFFEENKSNFGKRSYLEAKDDIEQYLIEKEVNRRLRDHIEDLRNKAYVKILLQ